MKLQHTNFDNKIIGIAFFIFSILLIFSIKNDLEIQSILKNGNFKQFTLPSNYKTFCSMPRRLNSHIMVTINDEKYSILINKMKCRNYKLKELKTMCENNYCIDQDYSTNFGLTTIKFLAIIALTIGGLYYCLLKS